MAALEESTSKFCRLWHRELCSKVIGPHTQGFMRWALTRMATTLCPTLQFPVLDAIPGIRAAFLCRCPGVDVRADRGEVLARLEGPQRAAANTAGFAGMPFAKAGQIHGAHVAVLSELPGAPVPDADGLATALPGVALAITVADCAAVFFAEKNGRAIALVHSGKKGTEAGIVLRAVALLRDELGCEPKNLVSVISPCIRPPHYEVDFAAEIRTQLTQAGVAKICDDEICTAAHPEQFYSYRREKGRTGRMLALLAITNPDLLSPCENFGSLAVTPRRTLVKIPVHPTKSL